WLLWRPNIWVEYAGIALFFVAAVLTLWSMLQYLSAARGDLLDRSWAAAAYCFRDAEKDQ
ncbi:hypothetical protein MJN85_29530, partial [Salmonella enterica subsp. enterica serovar Anatum]|nr:hypothetical protein [Salmonella enterica subsp. enterica serovar Anatum]